MTHLHLSDLDFAGKQVLLRVDYNVPLDKKNQLADLSRIRKTIPTLRYLLKKKARHIIILTHLGRPEGKRVPSLSTKRLKSTLEKMLRRKIGFLANVEQKIPAEQLVLFENLRFWKEEENNDAAFAQKLATLGDVYVNDAFSVCHRAHASVVGIPCYLPSCSGLVLDTEIEKISTALHNPQRPFLAIIGGAKVETKIALLENLLTRVDHLLIGGRMPFAFAAAQNPAHKNQKNTKIDTKSLQCAAKLLKNKTFLRKAILAEDFVAGDKDIGTQSIARFVAEIKRARTIVWNGTMGIVEDARYQRGTRELARAIAARTLSATTIVGGGETAGFVAQLRLTNAFSHVSTGGGAAVVLFEGGKLVGVQALEESVHGSRK